MKHILPILLAIGLSCSQIQAQEESNREIYLWEDFSDGIPDNYSLYDLDEGSYHYLALAYGFLPQTPWILVAEESGKAAMASISKYYYDVTANDWIVLPRIYVPNDAEDVKLEWESKSDNATLGGYSVFISTEGATPQCFPAAAVFNVDEESNEAWNQHSVSLQEYKGQTISIAFVNQTFSKGLLLVTDIKASGVQRKASMDAELDKYVIGKKDVQVKFNITANQTATFNSIKAYYTCKENTCMKTAENITLNQGESFTVLFDEKLSMDISDTLDITDMYADIDGSIYRIEDKQLYCISFLPEKKVVIEKGTGTWCGGCPSGIVAFNELEQKYPESFIGIEAHYGDELQIDGYATFFDFASYPKGKINRRYTSEPMGFGIRDNGTPGYTTSNGGFGTQLRKELEIAAPASLELEAAYNSLDNWKIDVNVNTRFVKDYSNLDLRLAFILTQDNVGPYSQLNSYAGSKYEMGGFENEKSRVNVSYNDVACQFYGQFTGIENTIPEEISCQQTYNYSTTLDIPALVKEGENMKLTACLIDQNTGYILNADRVSLGTGPTGINKVNEDKTLSVRIADSECIVETSQLQSTVTITDTLGRIVRTAAIQDGKAVISTQGLKGIFILNTGNKSRKISL